MLDIKWEDPKFQEMQKQFNALGQPALVMSHYDLANELGGTANDWKIFITEPEVNDYIQREVKMILQAELKKMASNISGTKSVGQAQAMQALMKLVDTTTIKKDGPIIIYTYMPLNPQEKHAPNVRAKRYDPFLRER
jgi:hypothetical protein